jgi:phosphohistidine phosphatase
MRTLIIMRHAKTEEIREGQKDFDRELLSRGVNDATNMGDWLLKKIDSIHEILSSTSKRTIQTAEIIKGICSGSLIPRDSLYHADANGLLEQIMKTDKKTKTLLVVGHNPAVSNLASYLSDKFIELKPSDIVLFRLKNDEWNEKL